MQSLEKVLTPVPCLTQAEWQVPALQLSHLAGWTGTQLPSLHHLAWPSITPQLVPSRGGPVSSTLRPSVHLREEQTDWSCSTAPAPSNPLKKNLHCSSAVMK